jgi:MFS family permease
MPNWPRSLSPAHSFWAAAATIVVILWTSAAPAVVYPLYADQWELTPTVTTALFAVYPGALVLTLIFVGNVSDYTGRRPAILIGMMGCLVGSALFAVGPSIVWLFLGRALMGAGVAFSFSAATVAMVEYSAPHQVERASAVATAASAVGLTVGLVLGGVLVQYGPVPTHLPFWVLTAVTAAVTAACWFLPRDVVDHPLQRWRPQLPRIRRGLRGLFAAAALAVTTAYATGGLMLSLGSQIGKELIDSDNALTNGAVLGLTWVVMGVTAIAARRVPAPILIVAGALMTATGVAALFASTQLHSLSWFLVFTVVCGVGYSGVFLGGLTVISEHAPSDHRGTVTSAVFLLAYLTQGSIVAVLGAAATKFGLEIAVNAGSTAIAVTTVAVAVAGLLLHRRKPDRLANAI